MTAPVVALLDDPPAAIADDDPAIRTRDDAVLELLYGSGIRVGELCDLGPSDLDLERARAVVWGKGGKQRAVPLSEPAVAALRRWIDGPRRDLLAGDAETDALFLNRRGRRLTGRRYHPSRRRHLRQRLRRDQYGHHA